MYVQKKRKKERRKEKIKMHVCPCIRRIVRRHVYLENILYTASYVHVCTQSLYVHTFPKSAAGPASPSSDFLLFFGRSKSVGTKGRKEETLSTEKRKKES